MRLEYGLEPLAELDRAAFDPARHLRPANAAAALFVRALLDGERAEDDLELVAITGSSIGWYTALAVAGALPLADAFRALQEVALLGEQLASTTGGGQVLYPMTDAGWRPVAAQQAAIAEALANGSGAAGAYRSIDFGSYQVLASEAQGVARLLERLPVVRHGERRFPLRLALQGPDHSPLAEEVAEAAGDRLSLGWHAPRVPLVDGRGARWSRWSTDPAALRDYSLGAMLVEPYDFATALRVALREYAPDHVVVAGQPGPLNAIVGQILVAEGYHGIRDRAAFQASQRSAAPLVLSMGYQAAT
jgi:malonyl CoA-acyl carrier protein transacylase